MVAHAIPHSIVQILEQSPVSHYNVLPPGLFAYLEDTGITEAGMQKICNLVLGDYLQTAQERLKKKKLPDSVRVLFDKELNRIETGLETETSTYFSFSNDLFLKDLGLVRLNLIPLGAELADVHGGIPRSLLFKGGVRQLIRGGRYFLFATKGFKPFYQLHLDPRNIQDFNPQGWHRTYLRLAELLSLNPQYKGFFGASWFYDPQLDEVSPHLSYLRTERLQGGAQLFRWGDSPSVTNMAINSSQTRKKRYESGAYQPCSYFLVWGKKELISWAKMAERRSNVEEAEHKVI